MMQKPCVGCGISVDVDASDLGFVREKDGIVTTLVLCGKERCARLVFDLLKKE